MNIEELEFIRDFCDKLDNLNKDICNFAFLLENKEELKDINFYSIWSIYHQSELIEELFIMFKNKIDKKYCSVWKQSYPYMDDSSLKE